MQHVLIRRVVVLTFNSLVLTRFSLSCFSPHPTLCFLSPLVAAFNNQLLICSQFTFRTDHRSGVSLSSNRQQCRETRVELSLLLFIYRPEPRKMLRSISDTMTTLLFIILCGTYLLCLMSSLQLLLVRCDAVKWWVCNSKPA